MRVWKLIGLTLALCLADVTAAPVPQTWAYLGWWLPEAWRSAPLGELDRILFFEFKVEPSGAITDRHGWPGDWVDLRASLLLHQTHLDLTLTLLEPSVFNRVFSSDEATQRMLDESVALGAGKGVGGIQLDVEIYELVTPDRIARFRSLVSVLASRLRELSPPRSLSAFVPMGGKSQLYDADTLALMDKIVLQGYDSHWAGSKNAGPVAPLRGAEVVTWQNAVAHATALGVTKKNMVLGFPLFGYEWPVKGKKLRSHTAGRGMATTFSPLASTLRGEFPISVQQQVQMYGAGYDAASGSSYYQYRKKNGQLVEGWFEDWWSLERKADYLVAEQLGGIAFFLLGYDNGQLIEHFLRRRGPKELPLQSHLIEKSPI